VLLHAAPQASASAAGPVPLGLTEQVVAAAGDGQVVVAGLRRSRVEMMRVDGGGRVLERRTVGGGRSADVRVAVAGRRIAVSWIEDQRTLVLARRALGGARFTFDGTSNSSIRFHHLAMNARGVVVDAFKDEDNAATETRTGIAGLVARPGQIARRAMIAPRDTRSLSREPGFSFARLCFESFAVSRTEPACTAWTRPVRNIGTKSLVSDLAWHVRVALTRRNASPGPPQPS